MPARLSRPFAERDLEEIWLYIAERWSLEQANRYQAGFIAAFRSLKRGNAGRPARVREGYRKLSVGAHVVFYRIGQKDGAIEIVRILHQRMDIERRL